MWVKTAKLMQLATYWPTYLLLKLLFRYKVEGRENLRGFEDKALIFASNHASFIDGPVCAAAMPRQSFLPHKFFPVRFLALKQLFGIKNFLFLPFRLIAVPYVWLNACIPVDAKGGELFKALKEAIKELKKGAKIWIYPEGTRTRNGKLRDFKRGVIFLHQHTGVPIVPVAVIGTFGLLNWRTFLGLSRIKIKIGSPMVIGDHSLEKGTYILKEEVENLMN